MTTVVPIQVTDRVPSHGIDLRLGDYREVLADVECDALIVDAPYSSDTHSGHDGGMGRPGNEDIGRIRADGRTTYHVARRRLNYSAWTPEDVAAFVTWWAPRTRGWFVTITDHTLGPAWADALADAGRYVFSPLACVEPGSRVRLAGDGPAQWSCWCVVARPVSLSRWGSLPGAYVVPRGAREVGAARKAVVGGKPLWLMQALVRDYSRPGDLVCDPCAGAGTTLLAAAIEGRRAVGAEMMAEHHALAIKRFARGFTPSLFSE
jgi:site-specific DNA-methyltransferase (adenine-specific)